jgi:hypothetical protein
LDRVQKPGAGPISDTPWPSLVLSRMIFWNPAAALPPRVFLDGAGDRAPSVCRLVAGNGKVSCCSDYPLASTRLMSLLDHQRRSAKHLHTRYSPSSLSSIVIRLAQHSTEQQ